MRQVAVVRLAVIQAMVLLVELSKVAVAVLDYRLPAVVVAQAEERVVVVVADPPMVLAARARQGALDIAWSLHGKE